MIRKLERTNCWKPLLPIGNPMILNNQITWCCSHQGANPSLTSQTAGLVIPTSSKTRYDCTLPFVWTDVVPKYLGLGKQEGTMSLEDKHIKHWHNPFFIIPTIISAFPSCSLLPSQFLAQAQKRLQGRKAAAQGLVKGLFITRRGL